MPTKRSESPHPRLAHERQRFGEWVVRGFRCSLIVFEKAEQRRRKHRYHHSAPTRVLPWPGHCGRRTFSNTCLRASAEWRFSSPGEKCSCAIFSHASELLLLNAHNYLEVFLARSRVLGSCGCQVVPHRGHFLVLTRYKLRLQPLKHFLRPPQRLLHVLADVCLTHYFRELSLMHQL